VEQKCQDGIFETIWSQIGVHRMNRPSNTALLGALIVICSLLGACAEFKQAGRTIGHTSRDVAREIGHGTRDAAKVIGKGTKRVVAEATAPTEDEEPTDD